MLDQILDNADANPLNDDDVLLFGPQAATACLLIINCQSVGGSGYIINPGIYYAEFTGIGSGTSGYSGNIRTFAVPGPVVGSLLPRHGSGVRLAGLLNYLRRRRAERLTKAQKARQAALAWRAKHPEEYKKAKRKIRERWLKKNPNYGKEWQAANREYVTQQKRLYRARKEK